MNISNLNKSIYCTFSNILPLYLENCIPKKAKLPYMVYSFTTSNIFEDSLLNIKIYCKGDNYTQLYDYSNQIENIVGYGFTRDFVKGNGKIVLRKGSPFSQVYTEEDNIQCMYFNIIMQVF